MIYALLLLTTPTWVSPVKISPSTDLQQLSLGDPKSAFKVQFKNVTTQPVTLLMGQGAFTINYKVELFRDGAQVPKTKWAGLPRNQLFSWNRTKYFKVDPGKTLNFTYPDLSRVYELNPGDYTLKLTFMYTELNSTWVHPVESESIKIRVTPGARP